MSLPPQRQDDPTLPQPWVALLDPNTGYTYYWNPQSNVTTYDRPGEDAALPPPSPSNDSPSYGARDNGYGGYADRGYENTYVPPSNQDPPTAPGVKLDFSNVRSTEEGEAYRRKHEMRVEGQGCPDPYPTFEAAGLPEDIIEDVKRAGFTEPTPIQAQSWACAMQGRDVVAIAKTGSGKTCGYLFPGIVHIRKVKNDPRIGPTMLILAPTRELAVQIKEEADRFGRSSGIRNTVIYGGASRGPQLRDIRYGVDIVIATPGRLNDFLESRQINLSQVDYLVLDEADRMLDMGFEPQIQRIVAQVPAQRQTLFYSATWPKEVRRIAAQFVVNKTIHVFIGTSELTANKDITQNFYFVNHKSEKEKLVEDILRQLRPSDKVIIFSSTKRMCDELSYLLGRDFRATAIHGDKSQNERDWVLRNFRSGRNPVMVATDVAARGLDIPRVAAVINYDFPTGGVEDYVHRIGRTGRAGEKGVSHTFMTYDDGKHARELVKLLHDCSQTPPPELLSMAQARYGGSKRSRYGGGRGFGGGGGRGYGGMGGRPGSFGASGAYGAGPARGRPPFGGPGPAAGSYGMGPQPTFGGLPGYGGYRGADASQGAYYGRSSSPTRQGDGRSRSRSRERGTWRSSPRY